MLGSEGLFAFDMKGKQIWKVDLGVLDSGFFMVPAAQWEFGSSPIIHEGKIIIQADVQKGSFLGAFDVKTGKELWRTRQPDVPTWSTPTIHVVGGRTQILVGGWRHMGAYDFTTGEEIWKLKSVGGDIPVPTPIVGTDSCISPRAWPGAAGLRHSRDRQGRHQPGAGYDDECAYCVELSARRCVHDFAGAVSGSAVRLEEQRHLFRVRCRDWQKAYQERLGDGTTKFTASLVAADGKVHFTSEDGDVYVVKAGRTYELMSKSPLGDYAMATPAIANGTLYFRTGAAVIAVK